MTEFNLSEKMYVNPKYGVNMILSDDVKEFIKRLKDERRDLFAWFIRVIKNTNIPLFSSKKDLKEFDDFIGKFSQSDEINKLAGKDLT